MNRRKFLATAGAATVSVAWGVQAARAATAATTGYGNVLVMVELQGGNDGLNTVIPFADPAYYALRPQLAIPREQVLVLDAATGLHPALQPLLALWQMRELAIVQGVGYPDANLSHFRSIEIWDTASRSNEYLPDGWLARSFKAAPVPREYAADGVVVCPDEHQHPAFRQCAGPAGGQLCPRPQRAGQPVWRPGSGLAGLSGSAAGFPRARAVLPLHDGPRCDVVCARS